ncbi:MAG: hypothetical protein QOF48_2553 [Verrucomicrobiota bacterium]|jgi:DNA-binding transcriptional regulator GbsR (MarR family)
MPPLWLRASTVLAPITTQEKRRHVPEVQNRANNRVNLFDNLDLGLPWHDTALAAQKNSSLDSSVVSGISVVAETNEVMKPLTDVQQKFILHWGEMGTRWGINRTVAQLHALLYLASRPLHAEEICEALGVARSNVSTSLRELQNWGLIKITHVLGDRRDHFEIVTADVWEMFRIVLDERKKREIDPTIAVLRSCLEQATPAAKGEELTLQRLEAMREFFEMTSAWYGQMGRLPTSGIVKMIRGGEKLRKLLGMAS